MLIEVDGQTWDTISEIFNGGGVGLRCKSKACSATARKGSGDIFKESDDGGKVNGSGGMTAGGDMVLTTTKVVAPIIVQFSFKNSSRNILWVGTWVACFFCIRPSISR